MADSKVRTLVRQALETQLPAGTPAEQVRSILDRPDAEGFVQTLNPQVLYQLIQAAGFDEAAALLPYTTPLQVQVCLDFDAWHKDQFQPNRLIPWFSTLLADSSDEHFRRVCRETDAEILAMLFKDGLMVGLFDEDGQPPLEFDGIDWTTSPDGVYVVAYPEDEDLGALLRGMLDRLYDVDRGLAWTLLEAARWELFSNMEEEELHWRNSRLEEFGFVGRDEAMEIYRVVDPAAFRTQLDQSTLEPKAWERIGKSDLPAQISPDAHEFYLLNIMEQVETEQLEALMTELVAVQNRVLIADGVEPGELEQTRAVVERAIGTMSLGLEFLARREDERALEIIASVPLRDLFRVGYSLQWKLRATVQQLTRRPALTIIESERFSLLSENDQALFDALVKFRPTFVPAGTTVSESFSTQDQIDEAAVRLAFVAFKQLWTFGVAGATIPGLAEVAYSGKLYNEPPSVTFDTLFSTWIAHVALGHAPSLDGLTVQELKGLPEVLRAKDWQNDPIQAFEPAIGGAIEAFGPSAARLITKWLKDTLATLSDELGAITDPSPELLESVLLIRKD
ncbi:MAG: DUF6178 family protein [bacterium]